MIRIAHFSDIHVTISPLAESPWSLVGKPGMGSLNYYLGGRRRHFAGVEARISALLEDVDAQRVDHAVCTGDLTAMSYDEEFRRCAELFGERLLHPERYTVIPGNHDRYTPHAAQEARFERYFGVLADAGRGFPFEKRLAEGVVAVALDVSRPTSMLDSSGLVGPAQLEKTRALLRGLASRDDFVVVLLHYGILREGGRPDRRHHGLRDYRSLIAILEDPALRVDLVLHGHMHGDYRVDIAGRPVICAGSATDLHRRPGYNVYEVDVERRQIHVVRRTYDLRTGRYARAAESAEVNLRTPG